MKTRNAIIIGASSGIGRELGKILAQNGYTVGLTARRFELLVDLQSEISTPTYIKSMDVSKPAEAMTTLEEFINEMGGMELLVINAGVAGLNPNLDWEIEKNTVDINVSGFVACANVGFKYFLKQGFGHLVGISSVAAVRAYRQAPAYCASKAFMSHYAHSLRHRAAKLKVPITITDIQSGHTQTPMILGEENLFWVAPPEKAARQIFSAIRHKRKHAYITHRWRLVAWAMKVLPDFLFHRL